MQSIVHQTGRTDKALIDIAGRNAAAVRSLQRVRRAAVENIEAGEVKTAALLRTARKLMDGVVFA